MSVCGALYPIMTHHILDLLRGALVHYGYWAVAVVLLLENAGVPAPGETVLLLASFLAYSQGELQLPWIIVVGTLASTRWATTLVTRSGAMAGVHCWSAIGKCFA